MTGPFKGMGDAVTGYWQTVERQNQAQQDNAARDRQLQVTEAQLKIQQEQAETTKIDTFTNNMDAAMKYFTENSRYLDEDEVAAITQMQTEWGGATGEYYLGGDKSKLTEFQKKYPGAALSLTKDGQQRVVSMADIYKKVQERKPRVALQDAMVPVIGEALGKVWADATSDPTLSEADRAEITDTYRAVQSGKLDPYTAYSLISGKNTAVTPAKLAGAVLAKGMPSDPAQLLAFKGMVDGQRTKPNLSAEDTATLDRLEGMYNPEKATDPQMKAAAAQRAALITAAQEGQLSTAKMPTAELNGKLFDNQGKDLDLKKTGATLNSTIAAVNAMNEATVGDANYRKAQFLFKEELLALENVRDRVGILANVAASGSIGMKALQSLRENPAMMAELGLTEGDLDTAITRAGQVKQQDDWAARLGTATAQKNLGRLGYPALSVIQEMVNSGEMTVQDAGALADYANSVQAAEDAGISVTTLTNQNESVRQGVIGTRIEAMTNSQLNVQQITMSNGYMLQAYELTGVRAKLAAGIPGQAAQTELATLLQQSGAAKNAIIVQDGQRQYLAQLTDAQMQAMVQTTRNDLTRAQVDGLYVYTAAEVKNELGIVTDRAAIATQTNVLNAQTAVAKMVGSAAVLELDAAMAGSRVTSLERENLWARLSAEAPYMGQLGVANIISQIKTGDATAAEAVNRLQTAQLLRPHLPAMIGQQVSSELAQGQLTEATARMAFKNIKWSDFKMNADAMVAVATMLPWEEARTLPAFATWANQNGIDKSSYEFFRTFGLNQQQQAAAGKSGGSATEDPEYNRLSNSEMRARQAVETARKDPEYAAAIDFLSKVKDPKVDVNALAQSGYSISALQANMELFGPEAKKAAQTVLDYKIKILGPLDAAYRDAIKARESYKPTFNPSQGSTGGTSGKTTAPQAVRVQIEQTAIKTGVSPKVLYGFIGAESTFNPNPGNYKDLDYVGYGQIGADAAKDVNAARKKAGLPALDRSKPDDNLQIAAAYLKMKLGEYGGDVEKAYAAYNMGSGNLNAHLRANGGKLNMRDLPQETQTGINNLRKYMGEYVGPSQDVQLPARGATAPAASAPVTAKLSQIKPGADLSKLGFSTRAIYNQKAADGSTISYCTQFAREFTEDANGLSDRALSGKWFGPTATQTAINFTSNGAMFMREMQPRVAAANAGKLRAGDLVFLTYGNPNIDHVAVYDGKGGFIQQSSPGFRGTTIQGSVNYMTTEQFFSKAGKATVSFGRPPSSGNSAPAAKPAAPAAPARTPAAAPQRPASTPPAPRPTGSTQPKLEAPKPSFKFAGDPFDNQSMNTLKVQTDRIIKAKGASNYGMLQTGLAQMMEDMVKDGFNRKDVENYVRQLLGK